MPAVTTPFRFERLIHAVGRVTILVLPVIGALALVEGAARLWHEPQPNRLVYDPFAYRIRQPGLVDTFESRDGEPVTVRLNELGMRGPSTRPPSPPDGLTLVFLGGSTTENYAYPLADTFPELVGLALAERLGRPVRVWNAGVSSATTGVSLGRLQHQVLDLEPDLVVVMHAINDLLGGFAPDFRTDGRHLPRPLTADRRPASYLWDWLRQRRMRRSPPALPTASFDRPVDDWQAFSARRVFERNLRSMVAVARDHGIPILLLTQPTMYRTPSEPGDVERFHLAAQLTAWGVETPDVPSLESGMAAFNATTLARAADGAAVLDLAARMPRSWELFYDECHYTREGNRRVAREILPVLVELFRAPE